MSEFRIDKLISTNGQNGVELPKGVVGVLTATSGFSGNVTGNVTGNLTGNVTASEINVTGVLTATSFSGDGSNLTGIDATSLKDSGDTVRVQANTSGAVLTGVVTATTSINVGDSFIKSGAVGLGTTTTAGRNAGVGTAVGTMVYDVNTGLLLYGNTGAWQTVKANFEATGGTITENGSTTIHTFTEPGNFIVSKGAATVDVEVLGGGGSGGSGSGNWTGGGGGGGYAYASKEVTTGTYPIVIGPGGARQSSCGSNGNSGTPSTAFGFTGGGGSGGGSTGGSPGPGGTYSIPGGTDLGSSNGDAGGGGGGDGSGEGGDNGKRNATPTFTDWGGGAAGVPNFTPGNNATGYGNGGSGGHSCQNGHNGGGSGSQGIVVVSYTI